MSMRTELSKANNGNISFDRYIRSDLSNTSNGITRIDRSPPSKKIFFDSENSKSKKWILKDRKKDNQKKDKYENCSIVATRQSNYLRYKTELCRSYEESGTCRFGEDCTFAHGILELRAVPRHPLYKTEPCRSWGTLGLCKYGQRCNFIHGADDLQGFTLQQTRSLPMSADACKIDNEAFLLNIQGLYALRQSTDTVGQPFQSSVNVGRLPYCFANFEY